MTFTMSMLLSYLFSICLRLIYDADLVTSLGKLKNQRTIASMASMPVHTYTMTIQRKRRKLQVKNSWRLMVSFQVPWVNLLSNVASR